MEPRCPICGSTDIVRLDDWAFAAWHDGKIAEAADGSSGDGAKSVPNADRAPTVTGVSRAPLAMGKGAPRDGGAVNNNYLFTGSHPEGDR